MKYISVPLMALLLLSACSKEPVQQEDLYSTRGIAAVANNNFNLTLFSMAMQASGYTGVLSQQGPFTVLAPSNAAFNLLGIRSADDIRNAGGFIAGVMPYHVLNRKLSFDTLAISAVYSFPMENNLPVYVSRWRNSRDSAITVNGMRLASGALPTSNGNIYLLDQVLLPSTGGSVQQAIGNEPDLTFFNAAVRRSGLDETLNAGSLFTVFAPSNQAFINAGIATTDSIYRMSPALVAQLLKPHMANGRHFINDYIFLADVGIDSYTETMLDNEEMEMELLPLSGLPGRFRGIRLNRANASTGAVWSAGFVKENLAASNGVVHIIDNLFVP